MTPHPFSHFMKNLAVANQTIALQTSEQLAHGPVLTGDLVDYIYTVCLVPCVLLAPCKFITYTVCLVPRVLLALCKFSTYTVCLVPCALLALCKFTTYTVCLVSVFSLRSVIYYIHRVFGALCSSCALWVYYIRRMFGACALLALCELLHTPYVWCLCSPCALWVLTALWLIAKLQKPRKETQPLFLQLVLLDASLT